MTTGLGGVGRVGIGTMDEALCPCAFFYFSLSLSLSLLDKEV